MSAIRVTAPCAKKTRPAAQRNYPKGRPLTKAILLAGPGQEDWSPQCHRSRRTARPQPSRKPAYTIVKTDEEPLGWRCATRTTNWCASPFTGRAREKWCGGSPPKTYQEETHDSRGSDLLRLSQCFSSGLTTQWSVVRPARKAFIHAKRSPAPHLCRPIVRPRDRWLRLCQSSANRIGDWIVCTWLRFEREFSR